MILECSSKGDKRFSALYAKVSVNNQIDTIENFYQKSKVFSENGKYITYDNWKEAKGKKPIAFKINNFYLPLRFGSQWYKLLWYKYLKANISLEKILEKYDDYNDCFNSKKAYVCQANVIREYMQDDTNKKYNLRSRGQNLYKSCQELLDILNGKSHIIVEHDDLLNTYANIIVQQVNCKGVMGKGLALTIKQKYPEVFTSYVHKCKTESNLLGEGQLVRCNNGKLVCNLFGQDSYGTNKDTVYTDYKALEKGLKRIHDYTLKNHLTIAIPYNIGCGCANGKWDIVEKIIGNIFNDYYVILYKI